MSPQSHPDFDPDEPAPWEDERRIKLVPASEIKVKPVHWLWDNRIPLGELTLIAGREDLGKSTIAYTLAAWITTGNMKGRFDGEPRAVVVAATEDSWEHTIVPRLIAAGADLGLVFRIDVTEAGVDGYLTLPSDISELRHAVMSVGAVLVLLDPLMSRLSAKLDSHKDAEVRVALEPLTSFAKSVGISVLGIIHLNKGSSNDLLTAVMGSRAFTAVPRSVLGVVRSLEDEDVRLFGQAKNNLGPRDPRTYRYRIVGERVAQTADGDVWTGKVDWLGKSDHSVEDVMVAMSEGGMEVMAAAEEAAGWLADYLESVGGSKESKIVKDAGAKAGHTERTLSRAASKLRIRVESSGFPRRTIWTLPANLQVDGNGATSLESHTTGTTGATSSHTLSLDPTSPVLNGASHASHMSLQRNGATGGEQR